MTVAQRLADVDRRLADACARAGRSRQSVTLVAVAKTFPVHRVQEAVAAGATDIAENRAQDLKEKAMVLREGVRWHFVGHLQTNKVRYVVGTAVLIHSVDRYALAEAISRRAGALGIDQDVLVEVNIGGERTKSGMDPGRAVRFATEVDRLEGVNVRGLMTLPPRTEDPAGARPYFRALAELGAEVADALDGAGELSMGMTRDFEVAVEEGSTLVRVGEAIFGPRNP